jgi:hypothetical protein
LIKGAAGDNHKVTKIAAMGCGAIWKRDNRREFAVIGNMKKDRKLVGVQPRRRQGVRANAPAAHMGNPHENCKAGHAEWQ